MSEIIFSQRSIFHLNQLSNAVSKQTSKRFRLTSNGGVEELIKYASRLNDKYVMTHCKNFMNTLDESHRAYLFRSCPSPTPYFAEAC